MTEAPARDTAGRVGLWAAAATAASATVALGLGVTTPARSGPNCSSKCITAPYADVAAFVPRDYIWMYAASLMMLLFVVLVAGVHHSVAVSRRIHSEVALAFAIIAAAAAVGDYAVQLLVLQPSLLSGEVDGLSL